ncbi:MAG: GNAT family N-acetyltransferase, partial [Myxococcota bacterium]
MGTLRIREAVAADHATLCQFNLAMAQESEGRDLDPEVLARGVTAVLLDRSRGVYIVAEREGDVVGQLMLTSEWSDWRCGLFWWIQSVYVVPSARRTGVYRALHAHVLSLAKAAGDVVGVRLYVEEHNVGA